MKRVIQIIFILLIVGLSLPSIISGFYVEFLKLPETIVCSRTTDDGEVLTLCFLADKPQMLWVSSSEDWVIFYKIHGQSAAHIGPVYAMSRTEGWALLSTRIYPTARYAAIVDGDLIDTYNRDAEPKFKNHKLIIYRDEVYFAGDTYKIKPLTENDLQKIQSMRQLIE